MPAISNAVRPRAPIKILSQVVIDQIAAGEVVERPVAVVKELLENSLDAGASAIEVRFEEGGKRFIGIYDDGIGMSQEDVQLALQRHATSKITVPEDLMSIASYGFRGEALPSIASVSRFRIKTRLQEAVQGVELVIEAGVQKYLKACGMPAGTHIEVQDLFYPLPARQKFLKKENTEAAHILHLVRLYALVCLEVQFRLVEDGREILKVLPNQSLEDRITMLYPRITREELMPLACVDENSALEIEGYVGKPAVSRATSKEIILFVNGRPVDNSLVNKTLAESYRGQIPKGRYPVAFLFLKINPAWVDVNVHPAKKEVRFQNEGKVRSYLLQAFEKALGRAHQAVLTPAAPCLAEPSTPSVEPAYAGLTPNPKVLEALDRVLALPNQTAKRPIAGAKAEEVTLLKAKPNLLKPAIRIPWRYLGKLKGDRFLYESESGVVILDLKAALRRIYAERVERNFAAENVSSQALLVPIMLPLEPLQSAILENQIPLLEQGGFAISAFGKHTYRLMAIPPWLEDGKAKALIEDFLDQLKAANMDFIAPAVFQRQLALLAVDKYMLSPKAIAQEAREAETCALLQQLFACQYPLNCPQGRPTYKEIRHQQLDGFFNVS